MRTNLHSQTFVPFLLFSCTLYISVSKITTVQAMFKLNIYILLFIHVHEPTSVAWGWIWHQIVQNMFTGLHCLEDSFCGTCCSFFFPSLQKTRIVLQILKGSAICINLIKWKLRQAILGKYQTAYMHLCHNKWQAATVVQFEKSELAAKIICLS